MKRERKEKAKKRRSVGNATTMTLMGRGGERGKGENGGKGEPIGGKKGRKGMRDLFRAEFGSLFFFSSSAAVIKDCGWERHAGSAGFPLKCKDEKRNTMTSNNEEQK